MKITSRLSSTQNFIELKVDEAETTIFKNSSEPLDTINNFLEVIDDICRLTGKNFTYKITEED